jgi:hypothetical protein
MYRTFVEAMYHAKDKEILPLIFEMILYVNPKAIPNLAIDCLSTLERTFNLAQLCVQRAFIVPNVDVVVDTIA